MQIRVYVGKLGRVRSSQVIDDRYRLEDRLGAGGMSVVWRAHDLVLDRAVALKILAGRHATGAVARARIKAEAQAAARLWHPHVTDVYDYGEARGDDGRPVPYVVMELLPGRTLAERLADGPLPPRAALRVLSEVAAALAAAHAQDVVHRDVKPSNVVLTPSGAKVVDFGLAAVVGGPEVDADGVLLGTPAYLAPERLTTNQVSAASDVYALGLLVHRALTNRLPWLAETTTQMLDAHVYADPAPLPALEGVPPQVNEVCDRCLAKEPADRPSAAEVAQILADAAGIVPKPEDDWSAAAAAVGWSAAALADATTGDADPPASDPVASDPSASDPVASEVGWAAPIPTPPPSDPPDPASNGVRGLNEAPESPQTPFEGEAGAGGSEAGEAGAGGGGAGAGGGDADAEAEGRSRRRRLVAAVAAGVVAAGLLATVLAPDGGPRGGAGAAPTVAPTATADGSGPGVASADPTASGSPVPGPSGTTGVAGGQPASPGFGLPGAGPTTDPREEGAQPSPNAPPPPPPANTAPPAPGPSRTIISLGGIVTVRCRGAQAEVAGLNLTLGYEVKDYDPGPAKEIQVVLLSLLNESEIKAKCEDGRVVPKVKESPQ